MPRPDMTAVADSMHALTIGTIKGQSDREAQRQAEGLMEREEQFQIAVSGRAEEFASWTEVDLDFEIVFEDATGQRDSDFDRPQFYYGSYVPVGGPVGITACVVEWFVGDRNETTGCKLAIGVSASDIARTFQGELHATFQGYGAPAHVYGDMESTDIE